MHKCNDSHTYESVVNLDYPLCYLKARSFFERFVVHIQKYIRAYRTAGGKQVANELSFFCILADVWANSSQLVGVKVVFFSAYSIGAEFARMLTNPCIRQEARILALFVDVFE